MSATITLSLPALPSLTGAVEEPRERTVPVRTLSDQTLLERVVIGQRFGFIWSDERFAEVFRAPCEEMLVKLA